MSLLRAPAVRQKCPCRYFGRQSNCSSEKLTDTKSSPTKKSTQSNSAAHSRPVSMCMHALTLGRMRAHCWSSDLQDGPRGFRCRSGTSSVSCFCEPSFRSPSRTCLGPQDEHRTFGSLFSNVHAWVHMCMRACVHVCMRTRVCVRACVRARV
jgi:hypothetical protein